MRKQQILIIILTFFVIAAIILFINPVNLFKTLIALPLQLVILLILLFIVDLVARIIRWWILILAHGNDISIPIRSLISPLLSSSLLNIVFPARAGEAVRLYTLKQKYDFPYSTGLSVIVVEQVINLLSLLLVTAIALGVIIFNVVISDNDLKIEIAEQLLPFILLGLIAALVGILLLFFIDPVKFSPLLNPFSNKIKIRGKKLLDNLSIGLNALRGNLKYLFTSLGISMLVWIFEGIIIWLLALQFLNPNFEWEIAMFASNIGNFTFMFPLLPGSIGSYEVFLGVPLALSPHYPGSGAILVGFTDRLIKLGVLAVVGGYATIIIGARKVFKQEEELKDIQKSKEQQNVQN